MKKILTALIICIAPQVFCQEIVPKERFGDLELGITYEDVIWILGFDGSKVAKENTPEMLGAPLKELNIDFDYVVNFRYIMELPVTSVYFKDNLSVFFTISSYPEYNQFICQDLKTTVGLKFWASLNQVKDLYGEKPAELKYRSGNIKYYAYKNSGICFGLDNNEVRTISIFDPDFK